MQGKEEEHNASIFEEILGVEMKELNEKKIIEIAKNEQIMNNLNDIFMNNQEASDDIAKELYKLANGKESCLLTKILIPSLVYNYYFLQNANVQVIVLHLFNVLLDNYKKEKYVLKPPTISTIYSEPMQQPMTSSKSKVITSNLTFLLDNGKESELDSKLQRLSTLKLSYEQRDYMTAFLIREFGKILITQDTLIFKMYTTIIERFIKMAESISYQFPTLFLNELVMSITYYLDKEEMKEDAQKLVKILDEYCEHILHIPSLLIVTAMKEYLTYQPEK